MDLKTYSKATGEEIPNLPWVNQLTLNAPNNVTLSWVVDSLIWYSVAYLQVSEVYQDDNRPARFEFVTNSRVTVELNNNNTLVKPTTSTANLCQCRELEVGYYPNW